MGNPSNPLAYTRPGPGFVRIGGSAMPVIRSAGDLRSLLELDAPLWSALSCPTADLEFPEETLRFLDTDNDGRIRLPEVRDAIAWTFDLLGDPDLLTDPRPELPLEALNPESGEGARLGEAARRILRNLGKRQAATLSLDDVRRREALYADGQTNGDGVITPDAARDPETATVLQAVITTTGGSEDHGGARGALLGQVDQFYQGLDAYIRWWETGHGGAEHEDGSGATVDDTGSNPDVFTVGETTPEAYAAFAAVRDVVRHFFRLERVRAYDPEAAGALKADGAALVAAARKGEAALDELLKDQPLISGSLNPEQPGLPLDRRINPYWSPKFRALRSAVLEPVLGEVPSVLTREAWLEIEGRLAPYAAWVENNPGALVAPLGIDRVRELRALDVRKKIDRLFAADERVATAYAALASLEKLICYRRDLVAFVNNFAAFPAFYDSSDQATFQNGTLFMDGRAFRLCSFVAEPARHQAIAKDAGIFLMYCQIRRHDLPAPRMIVAAATAGGMGLLRVGKNGLFLDRDGRAHDATVTQVVDHPISLIQAILAPFRRMGKALATQVDRIAASREQAVQSNLSTSVSAIDRSTSGSVQPPGSAPSTAVAGGLGGVLAGGGLALAAIGSSLAFMVNQLHQLGLMSILYGVLVLLLFLLAPSMILAVLRLRARDIGVILEAGGWAINGQMRLNFALSRRLTRRGVFPPGSRIGRLASLDATPRARGIFWFLLGVTATTFLLQALG
ncbi:MAG: hypothetical protein ACFE0O_04705 [Opitutales bacterium]